MCKLRAGRAGGTGRPVSASAIASSGIWPPQKLFTHSFENNASLTSCIATCVLINAVLLLTMEHTTAILEDTCRAVEADVSAKPPSSLVDPVAKSDSTSGEVPSDYAAERHANNDNRLQRKRKGEWTHDRQQHGSHGSAKRGRNDGRRHSKGDMGRGEYLYVHNSQDDFNNAGRAALTDILAATTQTNVPKPMGRVRSAK